MACTIMEELHLEAMELRLGLPGSSSSSSSDETAKGKKRSSSEICDQESSSSKTNGNSTCLTAKQPTPPSKAQVVGWPPIRAHQRNSLEMTKRQMDGTGMFVKVSVDGAPYLRKIDLKVYGGYKELLKALEHMFKLTIGMYSEKDGYKGSEFAPTYEDKDGDWMLVGDVPWEMFISTCKRLRIMRGSEARGHVMSPMTRKC